MLHLALTIFDFGLLILAWLVQAIIYPSFKFTDKQFLNKWHHNYQRLISYFVLPLMLGQLALSYYLMVIETATIQVAHVILLLLIWLSTFFQAVPLHQRIAKNWDVDSNIKRLIKVNLYRTLLWTLTFILSFISLTQNFQLIRA